MVPVPLRSMFACCSFEMKAVQVPETAGLSPTIPVLFVPPCTGVSCVVHVADRPGLLYRNVRGPNPHPGVCATPVWATPRRVPATAIAAQKPHEVPVEDVR